MNKTKWLIPALLSVIAAIISLLSAFNIDLWRAVTDFLAKNGSWEIVISAVAVIVSLASVFYSYVASVSRHKNIDKEKSND